MRWLVGIAVLAIGLLKLVAPLEGETVLPPAVAHLVALVEMLAGITCFSRKWAWLGGMVVVALCLVGLSVAFLFPGRPCGCLGSISQIDRQHHVMLSTTLGAAGVMVLIDCLRVHPSTGHHPSRAPSPADVQGL